MPKWKSGARVPGRLGTSRGTRGPAMPGCPILTSNAKPSSRVIFERDQRPKNICAVKLRLRLETVRHLAAAFSKLRHDLLVQPDIHVRRAIESAGITEFLGQLFAGGKTAVQFQQLHQIDDRFPPIEV